jgi:hypothetical protein
MGDYQTTTLPAHPKAWINRTVLSGLEHTIKNRVERACQTIFKSLRTLHQNGQMTLWVTFYFWWGPHPFEFASIWCQENSRCIFGLCSLSFFQKKSDWGHILVLSSDLPKAWHVEFFTGPEEILYPIGPPRVDHLDVVGRLTLFNEWKQRIHSAPLTREPGRAVALGRALVLTWPKINDLLTVYYIRLDKSKHHKKRKTDVSYKSNRRFFTVVDVVRQTLSALLYL